MKNLSNLTIYPTSPLKEAIVKLGQGGLRIVLVSDSKRRLLGTVTDGDIRRALLRNVTMDCPVSLIMQQAPIKASAHWSKEMILAAMEKHSILQMPIVNEADEIIGLETLHELLKKRRHDNPVLLVAGGYGTRLRPLTENCPKPLLKLGDKPILELILERLINSGFHRFFIATHYLSEHICNYFGDGSRWNISIKYLHESVPLGTGGALGLLPKDDHHLPVLMMNSDLLTGLDFQNLLNFHDEHHSAISLCVREYTHQVPFGVIEASGHQVTSIKEKPISRFFINAGIYLLSPNVVRSVLPQTSIDMPDILQHHLDKGENINMFPIHEYWLDVGRMDDYKKAQMDVESLVY